MKIPYHKIGEPFEHAGRMIIASHGINCSECTLHDDCDSSKNTNCVDVERADGKHIVYKPAHPVGVCKKCGFAVMTSPAWIELEGGEIAFTAEITPVSLDEWVELWTNGKKCKCNNKTEQSIS